MLLLFTLESVFQLGQQKICTAIQMNNGLSVFESKPQQ